MSSQSALYRLPHVVASGSWQMSLDSALLDWVCGAPARLVFRTYAWERPTLSLGRSEPYPASWDEDAIARAGIEVVRRPTGGGAVLHVEEVTFALAASLPGPWGMTPRAFSDAAAEALSAALRGCGLDAGATPRREGGAARGRDTLCFARSDPSEVEASGYKVAGIASRFGRGGALCHASVPLTGRSRSIAEFRRESSGHRDALEANARSVGELLTNRVNLETLGGRIENALENEIASRFEVPLHAVSFSDVGAEERVARNGEPSTCCPTH